MSLPLFVSDRPKPEVTAAPLSIGALIYEGIDQIDFSGPVEVLSRMPDVSIRTLAHKLERVRDVQGFVITPDGILSDAEDVDVLLVPGGHGQRMLMHDQAILSLIRGHVERNALLFSVCTGALLCGAAGVLDGRNVTTHWSVRHLMSCYGATAVDARVVVDGNIISAAGVTAGLDASLVLASLLRGDAVAQEIQLSIEYDPAPIFSSGSPEAASPDVLASFQQKYKLIGDTRMDEARRYLSTHNQTS